MNPIEMILQAGIIVQLVMLLLSFMSVYVWIVLFAKLWQIRSLYKKSKRFKQSFETSKDLIKFYNSITVLRESMREGKKGGGSPLEHIFLEGFAEFLRQVKLPDNNLSVATKAVQSKMWQMYFQQLDMIEQHSSTLATVGSSAPYIGLFGTVWGIINAFQGLSQVQHATLTLVAPGISEALIATAMGLFVAIPAVMGYNRIQSNTQRLGNYFENFVETFSRFTERQLVMHLNQPQQEDNE